jgi:hypothetical protein
LNTWQFPDATEAAVAFERRVFTIAWVWGVISLVPLYFLEDRIGAASPPAITHPEYFYGFIGCALAWQVVFWLIAREPDRLRPLMLVAVLEKLSFGVPALILFATGRVPGGTLIFAGIDLTLGALFLAAYARGQASVAAGREPVTSLESSEKAGACN